MIAAKSLDIEAYYLKPGMANGNAAKQDSKSIAKDSMVDKAFIHIRMGQAQVVVR